MVSGGRISVERICVLGTDATYDSPVSLVSLGGFIPAAVVGPGETDVHDNHR